MSTLKRGATLMVTLELTETEWEALWPWESIRSEAQQGAIEHEFDLTVDAPNRTILLTLDTEQIELGNWQFDIRAEKADGRSVFIPPNTTLSFTLIEGITD